MIKTKEVWTSIWGEMLNDKDKVIKETSLDRTGFSGECYEQIKSCICTGMKNVLETGCGTGRFIIALAQDYPDIEFEGSDLSERSVALASTGAEQRDLKNAVFYQDDMLSLKPKQPAYDLVYNEGSVEHFKHGNDIKVIKNMISIIKPGGRFLMGVPNQHCYIHTIQKKLAGPFYKYGYERSYKRNELYKILTDGGLEDIKCSGVGYAHACRRYGFPFTIFGNKYESLKQTDPRKAEKINDKKGFFLFISGRKPLA